MADLEERGRGGGEKRGENEREGREGGALEELSVYCDRLVLMFLEVRMEDSSQVKGKKSEKRERNLRNF